MNRRRLAAILGALTVLCGILCLLHGYGHGLRFIERLERATLDLRFHWRGPLPVSDAVVIVAVDDDTLNREPELSDRRSGAARLISAISQAEPAAIGIDAFYTDEERLLAPDLIADIRAYVATAREPSPANLLLARVAAETTGDAQLVQAIGDAGNVVLAMHVASQREPLVDPALDRGRYGQEVIGRQGSSQISTGVLSLPQFNAVATALGMVTVFEDDDHTVREMVFARRVGDGVYMPLAVPLVARYLGLSAAETAYLGDARRVQIGRLRVPLGPADGVLLNFRGPSGSYPRISAADVVADGFDRERLRGKIVLLGVTYFGHDTTRTPFGAGVPGVEIHATAIDTILHEDALIRATASTDALVCLLAGLCMLALFVGRLGPVTRILGVLAVASAHVLVCWWVFVAMHRWHGMVWPLATIGLVGGVGLALAYVGEAVQRVRLRRSFANYLGAEVLEELLADPSKLNLGGVRSELTVLFSDIREFTGLAERMSPEALVALLNEYLTPMSAAVLTRGGYLDKYIGDAVMAVYGAPVPKADHAARALATVVAMHTELLRLQTGLQARGIAFQVGVGVNTGEMVAGNMGSRERFDYTVIGDEVNLASRLEGLTKVYGVFCVVGPQTRTAAPAGYTFRELDWVRVKGKALPAAIHELLAGPDVEIAHYAGLGQWATALAAFRTGDFAAARIAFASFAGQNPSDPVVRLYLDRLDVLGETPPADWDGVVRFTQK